MNCKWQKALGLFSVGERRYMDFDAFIGKMTSALIIQDSLSQALRGVQEDVDKLCQSVDQEEEAKAIAHLVDLQSQAKWITEVLKSASEAEKLMKGIGMMKDIDMMIALKVSAIEETCRRTVPILRSALVNSDYESLAEEKAIRVCVEQISEIKLELTRARQLINHRQE